MIGVLAASAMTPAASGEVVGLPIHPAWPAIPSAVYQAPNDCFIGEGYGRYRRATKADSDALCASLNT
jgi:hypothetical protein